MVRLSELDEPGLQSLARLHQSVMRTLLTDLGLPLVLRYYRLARADGSVIGFCLVSSTGSVVGWVVGSPDPAALYRRLRTPVRWFAGQMLILAITRPAVLWQLLRSALSSANQMEAARSIELTYLGVLPNARGSGLGKSLLQAFTDASRAAGYRAVELSVETENATALGVYAKYGFVLKGTYREGHFERRRMELVL